MDAFFTAAGTVVRYVQKLSVVHRYKRLLSKVTVPLSLPCVSLDWL